MLKGIPFEENSFDVVYHSHVIEHFGKQEAVTFIQECFRVLKRGGVIRVAYPDLESIVRNYLTCLENALKDPSEENLANYDWMMLELYDQTVRNHSAGEMGKYLFQENISNIDFVIQRCGTTARELIDIGKKMRQNNSSEKKNEIFEKEHNLKKYLRKIKTKTSKIIDRALSVFKKVREQAIRQLLGKREYEYLEIGRFRKAGEIHQWMYDRLSMSRLLKSVGFDQVVIRRANESYIPDWEKYHLDTEPDGSTYKPDSAFMEGIKP